VPTVGFQPSAAFSAVMRTAMVWPLTRSKGLSLLGLLTSTRNLLISIEGGSFVRLMPIATMSCSDGRLAPVMPSVTGCSTCRRG